MKKFVFRFVSVFLSIIMLLSCVACSSNVEEESPSPVEEEQSSISAEEEDSAPVSEEDAAEDVPVPGEDKAEALSDPAFITEDTVDPMYATPVIDAIDEISEPFSYVQYTGHFEETPDARFTFCFPDKDIWEGRFIQMVYPGISEETPSQQVEQFAMNGAYTVRSNTPALGGYRQDAAVAKYSREIAAEYYGYNDHIYGYIYGGSGGGYVTLGAAEHTNGVYDGAMPCVIGTGASIPYAFTIRAFARFVLADKAPQIAEAVSPGGSGNPYAVLDDTESEVLREVTELGLPLAAWQDYENIIEVSQESYDEENAGYGLSTSSLSSMGAYALMFDPDYVNDFWNAEGYLGTEDSALGELFRSARIDNDYQITKIIRNDDGQVTAFVLETAPINEKGIDLEFSLVDGGGENACSVSGSLDVKSLTFTVDSLDESVAENLDESFKLHVSNLTGLALLAVHRYHIPAPYEYKNYFMYDQYMKEDGSYPDNWRSMAMPTVISSATMGMGTESGDIQMKTIVFCCLLDVHAYPSSGEWYIRQLSDALGDNFDSNVRIYFAENANHVDSSNPAKPWYYIAHGGMEMQTLSHLIEWVEEDVAAPKSTQYTVENSQIVIVSNDIDERGGIQPAVELTADKTAVKAGETVSFEGTVQIPENSGSIVKMEWDYLGNGEYMQETKTSSDYTYQAPGTYFASLRVTTRREKFGDIVYGDAENMDRIRVVVEPSELLSNEGVLSVLANSPDDASSGRVYGEQRYFPVGWANASGAKGEFVYADGVYTASVSGSSIKVTYNTVIWNGYEWIENGQISVEVNG